MKIDRESQKIYVISPFAFSHLQTNFSCDIFGKYEIVHVPTTKEILARPIEELAGIFVVNVYMDNTPRDPSNSRRFIEYIQDIKKAEYNPLIIGTSTVPISKHLQKKIVSDGAYLYVHAEHLNKELPKIITAYGKMMQDDMMSPHYLHEENVNHCFINS